MYTTSHTLYDKGSRQLKAQKIHQVLSEQYGHALRSQRVLDVGCSSGWIMYFLQEYLDRLVGVDIDWPALLHARQLGREGQPLTLIMADGGRLPFDDEYFDIVICAQVYEHVSNQRALIDEIWRVLKPGGKCFFSGPNRLAVVEEHYWLPFLSWLPRHLANGYLRLLGRGHAYDVYPRTYWHLRQLWRRFTVHDYTVRMIRQPGQYGLRLPHYISALPVQMLNWLLPFFPNYNWILEKPPDNRESLARKDAP